MDPQLRLMLEIAYEAIVDGGEETGKCCMDKTGYRLYNKHLLLEMTFLCFSFS